MQAALAARCPAWKILKKPGQVSGLAPASGEAIRRFVDTIDSYRRRLRQRGGSLAAVARDLVAEIGYQRELQRIYNSPEEQESRWASVEQAINAVAAYEKTAKRPTLGEFVVQTALDPREPEDDKQEQLRRNAVALLTLHAAKGLEFPHVYMVGMEEGLLPHHRSVDMDGEAIEEERRLCYVGITRAEKRLTFSMALTRMKWGKPRETKPSRFLYEITGQAEKAPSAQLAAARSRKHSTEAGKKARPSRNSGTQRKSPRRS